MLTGAKPEGFTLQLGALQNLTEEGVSCHPAAMTSFSTNEGLQQLLKRLGGIHVELAQELEVEELIIYPSVKRKIERHQLRYHRAYTPSGVPQERV